MLFLIILAHSHKEVQNLNIKQAPQKKCNHIERGSPKTTGIERVGSIRAVTIVRLSLKKILW